MINAGELDTRVKIERLGPLVSDGAGNNITTWETFTTVWGKLRPMSASETLDAGRLTEMAQYRLWIRCSSKTSTITGADRAVIKGVTYNIRSEVDPMDRGEEIELRLERGVAA